MARPKPEPRTREWLLDNSIPEPNSGCWLWLGTLNRDGYGWPSDPTRAERHNFAHRVSYELFRGDPGRLCVLHSCDLRCCVNPDHLFLGTRPDNSRDLQKKGRPTRPRLPGNGHLPRGVYRCGRRFTAGISVGGHWVYLGIFTKPADAALAFRRALNSMEA